MELDIEKIKRRDTKASSPTSIRLFAADVPKLKKLAKDKGMKFHAFIIEALHLIANSK